MGLDYIALANIRDNQPFFHLAVFFLWFTIINYLIRLQAISCFRRTFFSNVHFQIAGKQFFQIRIKRKVRSERKWFLTVASSQTFLWRFIRSTCDFFDEIRLLKGKCAFSSCWWTIFQTRIKQKISFWKPKEMMTLPQYKDISMKISSVNMWFFWWKSGTSKENIHFQIKIKRNKKLGRKA